MLRTLKDAMKNRTAAAAAIAVAVVFWIAMYALMVINVYEYSIWIYSDMNGYWYTVYSLALMTATAVLGGIFAGLLVYRYKLSRTFGKSNIFGERKHRPRLLGRASGLGGVVISFFASGCPTCGVLLFGLLGYPLGFMDLPFWGLELKIISLALLSISVFLMLRSIKKGVCRTDKKI